MVNWKKSVAFLIFVIAVLQIIHMIILSQLKNVKDNRHMSREAWNPSMSLNTITLPEYTQSEIEKDRKEMLKKMADRSIIDVTGTYHIIPHFMRAVILGRRNFIRQDLSLVTHSSLSQLKHLSLLVEGWDGLVSVAVFVSGSDVNLLIETILLLRRCSPQIRFKTSFHLVFPLQSVDTPNQHIPRLELVSRVSCPLIHEFFLGMGQEGRNYAQSNLAYPNNILRNVGRRHALTEYVLVIDVDLIVSHGLRSSFLQFAQQNNLFEDDDHHDDKRSDANNNRYEKEDGGSGYKKNVYVLPAYEMSRDMDVSKIPWNKTSLLKIMNDSKGSEVRPFYVELCWKCQKHTEYDVWEKEPETSKLTVLFEVLWKDPWEPFYISRNDVPFYDERFKQYGFNRISQVCELHVAGYKFQVLNNAFVIHMGFKTVDSFHVSKEEDLERNRILYRKLKEDLRLRYPHSSRRCY